MLRNIISEAANKFALDVIKLISSASFEELLSFAGASVKKQFASASSAKASKAAKTTSGRKPRASAGEIETLKQLAFDTVTKLAAKNGNAGVSRGDVMHASGSTTDLGRALGLLVAEGRLSKKGEKRLTRYFTKGKAKVTKATKSAPAAKKPAKKPAKTAAPKATKTPTAKKTHKKAPRKAAQKATSPAAEAAPKQPELSLDEAPSSLPEVATA